MSIDKMSFVNIIGKMSNLDETLARIVKCEMFHPENIEKDSKLDGFNSLNETNPYTNVLNKIKQILFMLNIKPRFEDYHSLELDDGNLNFIDEVFNKISNDVNEISKLNVMIDLMNQSLLQIKHMSKLSVNIENIFKAKYVDVRFGRMPIDSYLKSSYFNNKLFFFLPLDKTKDFCWGIYITPVKYSAEIYDCFKSLYFEEYCIPDYVRGTPQFAISNIEAQISEEKGNLEHIESSIKAFKNKNSKHLLQLYCKVKMLHGTFEYRKFAISGKKKFHINGFVSQSNIDTFVKIFDDISGVVVEYLPAEESHSLTPPVKLKTCWLFKPFEMYVETYGLPRYKDINPSSYMGLIYCIIFGIMFGDVGQGIVLFATGITIWKLKQSSLGLILTRCAAFSVLFGLAYGSCFGFEGMFSEFWQSIGLGSVFPMNLLESTNSMSILMFSLILGVGIIISSMLVNIFINLKNHQIGKAILSHNGLAGLVVYSGCFIPMVFIMTLNINILSPTFIVCAILIPLIIVFFSKPLSNIIEKKLNKNNKNETDKFNAINATFDMIEIILSYFSNTLSFLRIGGLALSHAALMLVVMQFSHMAGTLGSPIVIIIGNMFVMGLEGLLVSIQALRLVYYEIFSRFYNSDGKPFKPAKVVFERNSK